MSALAIDVGTSAVKAAAFDGAGRLIASAHAPMPPLRRCGDETVQPLADIEHAVDRVAREMAETGAPALVALTTQRDTALLLDGDGRPLTDLISWRDTRHLRSGSLWAALGDVPAKVRVRSLASHLVERWTGRAGETEATRPHHQREAALDALRTRAIDVDLPDTFGIGECAGDVRTGCALPAGIPVHLTVGDKNAELLGAGIETPGSAGLSIGSAISLGIAVPGPEPRTRSGAVVTRAGVPDTWNVETGLVAGTSVLDRLRAWCAHPDLEPDDEWRPELWCVPLPAGGLDDAAATGVLAGLTESTSPADLARAWAQGVACELAHLLPLLTADHGAPSELRVLGGGAGETWTRLLADVLGIPTRTAGGACGPRGALLCVRLHEGDADGAAALRGGVELSACIQPSPARAAHIERYLARYERLREAAVLA